ncbi:AraC family transcriptional regulator [Paenibacillus sp. PastF-1]|uniref:helix-turn-helix domain-containing protein n=1 Tax=unclassified Paenibacillus TaxID=185978 RepID=UPI00247C4200|nr:AraC-like DNA-binding protein [Paenibacillus sp. PastF-2]MDF9845769.1 AraC-like DNA-binding protein [Paenibacillus sp. PastM-2]MDF9852341.1 AraC-like DNA-binding protein [Paenibacillus sp. PastF-1]MDH6477929.1 AraC-like DNA-binding protein [Paenibacillus sp. PastH-2]MDH6505667.1 AraC-like DNA-binding protein [Paenibacillus sp. PastM-3]
MNPSGEVNGKLRGKTKAKPNSAAPILNGNMNSRLNGTHTGNLTGRLLQNLTVRVTHAQLSSKYPGWDRSNETPSFNRLYFIDSGEGKVIINGETHYPHAGHLMIMPAGTTQTSLTYPHNSYVRYYCHFDAQIGEWPLFHNAGKLYICEAADPDAVRAIFTELIALFQDDSFLSTLRRQASLLQLLAICLEGGGYANFLDDVAHTGDHGKLASVLGYIEEHLHEPMEVEDLAGLVHLHPNYFIPYFKKFMGMPPMHYVQYKRMEQAKRQLSGTKSSIGDIAEQVGMELAHFSKVFKKTTGVSPSAYRSSTR